MLMSLKTLNHRDEGHTCIHYIHPLCEVRQEDDGVEPPSLLLYN